VNELARLCDRIGGISIWEVVQAAATKPFGFMPFWPGPGLGGHCIPIDPYYLSWLARKYDFETSFITLSARINEEMPFYVVEAVMRALAEQPVGLKQARILILGVAFKKDVDDVRHSPAIKLIEVLRGKGFTQVQYSDPHVEELWERGWEGPMRSVEVSEAVIREQEVVVVVTNHSAFPYAMIAEQAKVIVDTRNALAHIPHNRDKIMVLGGGGS
jgi:UDP-N-acetyl-D-glucosamine dehydrogenase